MRLIPVIDLSNGQVVQACHGNREAYRPWISPLTKNSSPIDIISAFLELAQFKVIYIADLNAIEKSGENNQALITSLTQRFRHIQFWVDAGLCGRGKIHKYINSTGAIPIYGSENQRDGKSLRTLLGETPNTILSLDINNVKTDCIPSVNLWTKDIIIMSLFKVGSNEGPDIATLRVIQRRADNQHNLYAAGGIRGMEDIITLAELGIHGVLIASALHNRKLNPAALSRLAKNTPFKTGYF